MQGFRVPRECFGVLNNVLCTAAAIAEWSVCVCPGVSSNLCVLFICTLYSPGNRGTEQDTELGVTKTYEDDTTTGSMKGLR